MKIIHSSDWHIGRTLRSYSRDDDHRHFIAQLCDILATERPDALLVSGDIYDNPMPSVSAQNAFVKSLLGLHTASPDTAIIITSGNHDSGSRLDVHRPVWDAHNVTIVGADTRPDDGEDFDLGQFVIALPGAGYIVAVPYYHRYNYPALDEKCPRERRQAEFFKALLDYTACINTGNMPVFMMAHLTISGCDATGHDTLTIGGEESVPSGSLGNGADYIALGHIHKPQWVTADTAMVRYSGSPYPMTFAEDYEHSVTMVEIDKHGETPRTRIIPLETLHRLITVPDEPGTVDDALTALEQLQAKAGSLVRLQVLMSSTMPADADLRAYKIAESKELRFCNYLIVDDTPESETASHSALTLDQISTADPVEIAKMFYQNTISRDIPQEYLDMLRQIVTEVDQTLPNTDTQP